MEKLFPVHYCTKKLLQGINAKLRNLLLKFFYFYPKHNSMHLENILNATNPASHEAFIKEQLPFTTTTDRNIATMLDNHNKEFTTALVTAIRQLQDIAINDNMKRQKKLKQVLNKYAATKQIGRASCRERG